MKNEDLLNLTIARIERAKELFYAAIITYKASDYKSANNRAYYAVEKATTSLLILCNSSPKTHHGILSEFNRLYIHENMTCFDANDLIIISNIERIRSASDYDDFYVASQSQTHEMIKASKAL